MWLKMGPVSNDAYSSKIKVQKIKMNSWHVDWLCLFVHRSPGPDGLAWEGPWTELGASQGLGFVTYETGVLLSDYLRAASSSRPWMRVLCEEIKVSPHEGILASRSLSSSLLIIIHNDVCKMELLQSTVAVNSFHVLSPKSTRACDDESDPWSTPSGI